MAGRGDRLKHLVKLQKQVTEIHEMRRATFLAKAEEAKRDAAAIIERTNDGTSMSHMFPEVYARYVERAAERQRENEELAAAESLKVAAETARANLLEKAWREASRAEERQFEERAGLDAVEQKLTRARADER